MIGIGFGVIASAGSFSPTSLPSMTLWLDGSKSLYQDAAGTTPATADGDGIKNAPDQSGSGNTLTQSATGAVLRIVSGKRVVSFEGGYLFHNVSSGTLSAFSLHMLVKVTVPTSYNVVATFGASAAAPFLASQWVSGQFSSYLLTTSNQLSAPYHTDPTWRVLSVVFDGSNVFAYLDGAEISGIAGGTQAVAGEPATPFTRAGLGLGKETTFNNAASMQVAEWIYYEASQTAGQAAQVAGYLRTKWGALLDTTDPQVVWVGNSLSTNFVVDTAHTIPYLAYNASVKIKRFVTACRPSITTAQMLTRVSGDYAKFVVAPSPKIAVVWEGTNDVTLGASAATAYANLVSLAQALKTAGYTKIVMGTVLPRTGLNNTTRGTLNTSIRGNSTDWDVIADVAGDATIGPNGTDTNTTYYSDGTHMTNAGNAIACGYFQTAIDGLLP
jgi:hypothetical protein